MNHVSSYPSLLTVRSCENRAAPFLPHQHFPFTDFMFDCQHKVIDHKMEAMYRKFLVDVINIIDKRNNGYKTMHEQL